MGDALGIPEDGDPFNITPTKHRDGQNLSAWDSRLLSLYAHGSPSQAKRTLEAHIADTDRRIQEASKIGTNLVDQKQQLAFQLKELDQQQGSSEISHDLRQKLIDLEKEVTETSKESARAFIPRSRDISGDAANPSATPTGITADGRPAPVKAPAGASSRKLRNHPSNEVKDVEFATEISTSLLAQVRNLQGMLAEKTEALKSAEGEHKLLQEQFANLQHRLNNVDDDEQHYKDENWNLETQVQDLTNLIKEVSTREEHLKRSLHATQEEKSSVDREHDDLRQMYNKLLDDHGDIHRQHELDLSGARRDLSDSSIERDQLQKKVEELSVQNQDLAKAIAYRKQQDFFSLPEESSTQNGETEEGQVTPERSPPPSPTKGTPRHGALESETLRSSLTHAHRMIQNLKNSIHREKTEKGELKRMLQDARDEIETRRADGGLGGNAAKKRSKPQQDSSRRLRPGKLGEPRGPRNEIINDPSWEDHDSSVRPSVETNGGRYDLSTDASDAFATADERPTDTEAFETGAESLTNSTDDDATETEGDHSLSRSISSSLTAKRNSMQSTASDDDDYDLTTPPANQPRYKLKLGRGRSSVTPNRDSPASFTSNRSQNGGGLNLADELENMDAASAAGSTPSRKSVSRDPTPSLSRYDTTLRTTREPKPAMVDSGMTTDSSRSALTLPYSLPEATPFAISGMISQFTASTVPNIAPSTPRGHLNALNAHPVGSSIGKEGTTTPSTQAILNGILRRTSSRSTPGSNPRNRSSSENQDTVAGTPERDDSEAFKISIPGRDTKPRKIPRSADSTPSDVLRPNRSLLSDALDEESPGDSGSPSRRRGHEPRMSVSKVEDGSDAFREPTLQFGGIDENGQDSLRDISTETPPSFRPTSSALARDPTAFSDGGLPMASASMIHESTQTAITSDQIDSLLKSQYRKSLQTSAVSSLNNASPRGTPSPTGRAMSMSAALDQAALKSIRKPGSASGNRTRTGSPPSSPMPPLPPDHKEVIAAASRSSSMMGSIAPPVMPMSSARLTQEKQRPRTPSGTFVVGTPVKVNQTPRNRNSSMAARSDLSRRSSVSSFASELDERFNISAVNAPGRNQMPFDNGLDQGSDPRMILAITQTMIGEFLWKYTRKAGRGELSEKRHKRFFWIHPYTRTLYWSNQDPSTAGRVELKAKSVSIEAIRVISDNNPIPPGLHTKSLIVVTPGRSIKFTAPTSQRHETWFNALTYLLLRNNEGHQQNHLEAEAYNYSNINSIADSQHDRSNTLTSITSDDLEEFNPSTPSQNNTAFSRNASRLSRASMGSSMSSTKRTPTFASANRTASPQGRTTPSLAVRQSQAAQKRAGSANNNSSPLGVKTMPRLSESERGANGNFSNHTRAETISGATGLLVDNAGDKENMTSRDGEFKKPKRPASYATGPKSSLTREGGGRLSSLTSKLRPPSFSSLKSRRKSVVGGSSGLGEKIGNSSQISTEGSQGGSVRSGVDGEHHHEHEHGNGAAGKSGKLENVRACCDGKLPSPIRVSLSARCGADELTGKHDVGGLHHRGTSRRASVSSRSSRTATMH